MSTPVGSLTTTATLDRSQLRLEAGGEATVALNIRNNGQVVEGYRIEVLGPAANWTAVLPPEVTIYPGDSATATLAFHPPRSPEQPAGLVPFGVRVVPASRPDATVVPEGAVEVAPFLATAAELVPRTSHGRRTGKHRVAVDNRGNVEVQVLLAATDPTGELRAEVTPESLIVQPGNAAFADVRIRSSKRIWRGASKTHPFTLIATPHGDQALPLEGSHVQDAVLPRWFLKALIALIALLALLAALWFLVLKPTIKSAAKDAVKGPLAKASSQAAAAQKAAAGAQQAAAAAAAGNGQPLPSPAAPAAPAPTSAPFANRLSVLTSAGASNTAAYTVPAKTTLHLTDLIFENPQGDFGTVTLTQNGASLMTMALENFRESDYHFVSPIVVPTGGNVTITVRCNAVGKPPSAPVPTQCNTAVLLGGTALVAP